MSNTNTIHENNAFTLLFISKKRTASIAGNITRAKLKQQSSLHFPSGVMAVWGYWEDSESIKSKSRVDNTNL